MLQNRYSRVASWAFSACIKQGGCWLWSFCSWWLIIKGAIATYFHTLIYTCILYCPLMGCRPGQTSPCCAASPQDPSSLPREAAVKEPTRSQVNLLEGKDREELEAKRNEVAQHLLNDISKTRCELKPNSSWWFWTDTSQCITPNGVLPQLPHSPAPVGPAQQWGMLLTEEVAAGAASSPGWQ